MNKEHLLKMWAKKNHVPVNTVTSLPLGAQYLIEKKMIKEIALKHVSEHPPVFTPQELMLIVEALSLAIDEFKTADDQMLEHLRVINKIIPVDIIPADF